MPRLNSTTTTSNKSGTKSSSTTRYTPYTTSSSSPSTTFGSQLRRTNSSFPLSSSSSSSQRPNNPTFNVRYNSSGYRQFKVNDSNNGSTGTGWQYTHRRVAEKKIGREISPTEHVHHINKNKTDNRAGNLVVMDQHIHQHLHSSTRTEKTACFRCGNTSHYAGQCYAGRDVFGRSISGNGSRTNYYRR